MIWELSQLNARQLIKHKKRSIQQAYKKTQHSNYQMPRNLINATEDSIEEIPSLYDLHTQNVINREINLMPLNKLVVLNSKRNSSASKKITITHVDARATPQFLRKNRINCTLSKNSSRNSFKSVSRGSWCCCLKDQDFQQFQTKQLTMKDEYRQSRALSHIFQNQKAPSKTLKHTRVQK